MSAPYTSSLEEDAGLAISQADLIILSESLFANTHNENGALGFTPSEDSLEVENTGVLYNSVVVSGSVDGTCFSVAGNTGTITEISNSDTHADAHEDAWISDFLAVFNKVAFAVAQT